MRHKESCFGFSLLEIVVVVTILGFLVSFAVPRYLRVAEKGRLTEAKSILSGLRNAQVRYMLQMEHFTNVLADLDTQPSGLKYFNVDVTGTDISNAAALVPGTYVAYLTRNTNQNVDEFPTGYAVRINQLGVIDSTNADVQQKLI